MRRRARVALRDPLAGTADLRGITIDESRTALSATTNDVGRDLSELLRVVTAAGGTVTNVAMGGATLQDVFIALTGRELRE